MPLIDTKFNLSDGHILIWRLEESIEELQQNLPSWLDYSEYHRISHPLKKREWLAGRRLFSAMCQRAGIQFQGIWKNPEGKPFLIGSGAHISLSHSEHFVAAAIHPYAPLGIDLERPKEQLLRVATKFLSIDECTYAQENLDLLCRFWSAKEAVFKLFGQKQVSFRHHIRILPPTPIQARWSAHLNAPQLTGQAWLTFFSLEDYYLTVAQGIQS